MAILNRESTSFVSKRFIAPIVAPSDYKELIGATDEIGLADTSAVIPGITGIATQTSIGNTWALNVQDQGYGIGQVVVPTYVIQARWKYNILEEANLERNVPGLGMQHLQDKMLDLALGMRIRQLVLHGNAKNEGLVINTITANISGGTGAAAGSWKQDPGKILQEILHHVDSVMASVYSRGKSIKICMPTALKTYLNTALIGTSSYLNSGSTHSVGGALQIVLEQAFKKDVSILEDNTLINSDNKYQMLIVVPTLEAERGSELYDTSFELGDDINTYLAISGLQKGINPAKDGFMSGWASITCSSGINLRKEGSLLLSGTFA